MKSSSRIIRLGEAGGQVQIEEYTSDHLADAILSESEQLLSPDDVLARAREEADGIREEALRMGYEEGIARAREEVLSEMLNSVRAFRTILGDASTQLEKIVEQAEIDLLKLAGRIAERILGREVRVDSDLVNTSIRKAIQTIVNREGLVIRVNPDDMEVAREAESQISETFDGIREVTLIRDGSVARGGAIVETQYVKSDAELMTQLEQIMAELEDAWNRS